jgi:hypothetical protein
MKLKLPRIDNYIYVINKINKVIFSCTKESQLKMARRYCYALADKYINPLDIDETVWDIYQLRIRVHELASEKLTDLRNREDEDLQQMEEVR